MNIAQAIIKKEKANKTKRTVEKLDFSDIELLQQALTENFLKYFDVLDNEDIRIKREYVFVAYDTKKSLATTLYTHGYKPSINKNVLSLTVSEHRDPPSRLMFRGDSYTPSIFGVDFAVRQSNEIDITIALEDYKYNLRVIGAIDTYTVVNDKVLYVIRTDSVDVTYVN